MSERLTIDATRDTVVMRGWLRGGDDVVAMSLAPTLNPGEERYKVLLGKDGDISGDDEDSLRGHQFVRLTRDFYEPDPDELTQVLDLLPERVIEQGLPRAGKANAYVCKSDRGIEVFPVEGGWLRCDRDDLEADIAPFAG